MIFLDNGNLNREKTILNIQVSVFMMVTHALGLARFAENV